MKKNDPIKLPQGKQKLLLHSCCAPCSGSVMEDILDAGIDYSILFYNPNIHPIDEYNLRKNENVRFAEKNNIEFIDLDYDTENWFKRIKGFEDTPERGYRCTICFEMRFERTALYAFDNGFDIITSCLGISRWKNMDQINTAGTLAASRYPNISYWTYNWRKAGGSKRMIELAKEEEFYQQQYCGCVYSLRDTNRWRLKNNRSRVKLGQDYYKKEQ
ncbi:MAG: epoxyqueuosine reductase QueH [Legionellales bacterium]|jgi:epoxyqueuosine reductase|nr:epoxyqueuosine reductase QueH [Legionellales bacterium]